MRTIEKLMSTKAQRLTIMGAINYKHDIKVVLASEFSNGRTDSLTKLFFKEADELIKSLKSNRKELGTPRHLQFDLSNSKHKYIMSLCRQLGWVKYHERLGTVVNMKTLYDWLMSEKSPVNKCLMNLSYPELSKIIFALEQILDKG